jgi:hypothetical protein
MSLLFDKGIPSQYNIRTNIASSAFQFTPLLVPIGTATLLVPNNYSTLVVQAGETLASVTWTLPLVSACPGLQISIVNKSTSTTINLLTQGGNLLPAYLSPAQIPPSGGPGNDQFFYFQSDSVDTWQ